jgi:hypothetical protein
VDGAVAAAWVQALGSVGAIIYAGWVAHSTERKAARNAADRVLLFGSEVHDALAALESAISAWNVNVIERERRLLCQLSGSLTLVRDAPLPAETLKPMLLINSRIDDTLRQIEDPLPPNKFHWETKTDVLRNYRMEVRGHLEHIAYSLNRQVPTPGDPRLRGVHVPPRRERPEDYV